MSPSSQPDDADLWAQWGRLHGRAVRGYVWAMVHRHDLAEDLTQEVFVRAWQAWDRYQERGTARAYLFRIADRLVVDYSRKPNHEVHVPTETWHEIEPAQRDGLPEEALADDEARRALMATLDALTPPQRRVLLMRYYGELSFAEIAAVLDCPLNTALSHCQRGLTAMRKLLVETSE